MNFILCILQYIYIYIYIHVGSYTNLTQERPNTELAMAIINGANFGLLAYSQGKLWRVTIFS